MPDRRRTSPLAHRHPLAGDNGLVSLAERPFLGRIVLRARADLADAASIAILGGDLPKRVARTMASDNATIFWIGPDEWMIITAPEAEPAIAAALDEALAGIHHQVTIVSDYYTAVEIAGPRARTLLSKLTTLDMHPRAFRPGEVRAGLFARINGILFQRRADEATGGPAFDLSVRWSMADHLWCTLAMAGREWGLPHQRPRAGEPLSA